jgi:hypothetical protein
MQVAWGTKDQDPEVSEMVALRTLLGEALRDTRLRQERTLREVSKAARVSLGYLSEVERGQKEASSELLASICWALGIRLSDLLREVSDELAVVEPHPLPVLVPVAAPVPAVAPASASAVADPVRVSAAAA